MVMVPAVALGALAVFAAGYMLTYALLKQRRGLPEEHIESDALLGGGLAVLLLVLSLFVVPRHCITPIWVALTVIGIAFGLFTFIAAQSETTLPPRHKDKSTGSGGRQPPQQDRSDYVPSVTAPPAPKEDPYRTLLARVRYDQKLVDRLIEEERGRMPLASSDDLCRSILARMKRDNSPPT
jgi:hypothetical protein